MRSRMEVRQLYRYTYSAPITQLRQKLMMVPADVHASQRLVRFSMEVRGADQGWQLDWSLDQFGNRICRVVAPGVQRVLEFDAHYVVEHVAGSVGPTPFEPELFLAPTPLTAPSAALAQAALDIATHAGTPEERAERAHTWAAGAIAYQLGITGVHTPAAVALDLGRGVCQDYAHILLCVLRLLHIPARYVSGQLPGDGVPHAWVEASVGDQVIAYDPTHHRRATGQYISVAVGRDYNDVAPTSGTFTGSATGALSASKYARAVIDLDATAAAQAAA